MFWSVGDLKGKILFLMSYPDWEVERMRRLLPDYVVEVPSHYLTETEIIENNPDAKIVIPVNNTKALNKTVLQSLTNLKLIQQAGTGLEYVDLKSAESLGITVATAVGANAQSVAEQTFAYILSLSSRMPFAAEFLRSQSFKKEPWPPRHRPELLKSEISGKTLGLIGIGSVGARVAKIAIHGFDMKVLAFDPYVKSTSLPEGIALTDIDTVLKSSDVISIHATLNDETKNMIGKDKLGIMKKTAFLINTARGGIVEEKALLEALKRGQIAGAGLDTYSIEPPATLDQFLALPNVVLTPHIGGNSTESKVRVQDVMVENIRRLESGTSLLNVVVPKPSR